MDVRQLEYFHEVGKVSHISRAAERVGITQPTLSRAIERLEHEIGAPLIERAGRSIQLTSYGKALWKHIDRALESIEAGRREVADMTGEERGTVALGFLWALGERLVPELVRGFTVQHPAVRFRFVQNNGVELERQLMAGDINFAMLAGPIAQKQLEWQSVAVQQLVLVVPPGHRFAHRRTIRLAEAAHETFVLFPPGHALRAFTDDLCRRADFVRSIEQYPAPRRCRTRCCRGSRYRRIGCAAGAAYRGSPGITRDRHRVGARSLSLAHRMRISRTRAQRRTHDFIVVLPTGVPATAPSSQPSSSSGATPAGTGGDTHVIESVSF
jgi:DNA-binding transcriptional LysR family regulator